MIQELNSDELKGKIESGEKFRLIDVREADEYEAGHIEGAVNIPLSNFKQNHSNFLKDQNEKLIMTCRSGGRSMAAAKFLESKGFKNLTNHEGGAGDWSSNGYPLSGSGKVLPSSLRQMPDLS